jgi:hypothetical protein
MSESEWRRSNDVEAMLAGLPPGVTVRKLRLFATACCRQVWDLLTDPRSRQAVEAAEAHAEGSLTAAELEAACEAADAVVNEWTRERDYPWAIARSEDTNPLERAAKAARACAWSSAPHAARGAAFNAAAAERAAALEPPAPGARNVQCDLLRDLLGNPYRPVVIQPAWINPTVRAVAQTIYDERRFEELPILGDALAEAGCTDDEILAHCRSGKDHARGCWLVDSLLGRDG